MKELSEMTIKELWELFPIILKEHNPAYKDWYEEEKEMLIKEFKDQIERINHIGSTAVDGLIAKPTVDILMEVSKDTDIEKLRLMLRKMGWILMCSSGDQGLRHTYNKGYTKYGFAEKVYHLHVRYKGDWNELYFRDYLINHPKTAKEYGELKLKLYKLYEHDRDAYTEAKAEFVTKVSEMGREEFKGKYY